MDSLACFVSLPFQTYMVFDFDTSFRTSHVVARVACFRVVDRWHSQTATARKFPFPASFPPVGRPCDGPYSWFRYTSWSTPTPCTQKCQLWRVAKVPSQEWLDKLIDLTSSATRSTLCSPLCPFSICLAVSSTRFLLILRDVTDLSHHSVNLLLYIWLIQEPLSPSDINKKYLFNFNQGRRYLWFSRTVFEWYDFYS